MKHLAAAGYRRMPWKNGQGVTREIAREPAEGEDFLWRLSIAEVAASGDFSLFPGYDRTITLIEGAGMRLVFEEAPEKRIEHRFGALQPVLSASALVGVRSCVGTGGQLRHGDRRNGDFDRKLRRVDLVEVDDHRRVQEPAGVARSLSHAVSGPGSRARRGRRGSVGSRRSVRFGTWRPRPPPRRSDGGVAG